MEQEKMATALVEVFNIVSKDNTNDSAKIFGVDLNAFTTAKEIGRGPDNIAILPNWILFFYKVKKQVDGGCNCRIKK